MPGGKIDYKKYGGAKSSKRQEVLQYLKTKFGNELAHKVDINCTRTSEIKYNIFVTLSDSSPVNSNLLDSGDNYDEDFLESDDNGFNSKGYYVWHDINGNQIDYDYYDKVEYGYFDIYGFDVNDINKETGTSFDSWGFNRDGIHKDTGTDKDKRGYTRERLKYLTSG